MDRSGNRLTVKTRRRHLMEDTVERSLSCVVEFIIDGEFRQINAILGVMNWNRVNEDGVLGR